ncbi:MAG: STAS domain-containing protein [Bryobacteraceae bacterium]
MSLEIEQSEREGITILNLNGRLIVGEPVTTLRARITRLSAAGANNVVLNLSKVDYIDSTGLGGMVIGFTMLKKAGGALKLAGMNRRNLELLVLTKLSGIFETYEDEQTAVNSFFPGREIKKFDILSFVQGQEGENET